MIRFDAVCSVKYAADVEINARALTTSILWLSLTVMARADSSSMVVIRYDSNGRPIVQESAQTKSVETRHSSAMRSVASKIDAQNRIAMQRESTVITTQPSPSVRKSESSTQVRDSAGNIKTQSKAVTTETQVASDTVKTETEFQEGRSDEMKTTGRMVEVRKQKSDGSEYQRTFETRSSDGEFRPKQKVESQTTQYSSGASRTRTVESAYDRNGNVRPTQETVERQSAEFWGKQTIERIIKRIETSGDVKLDRVELEERNLRATNGVVNELVVKKPDSSYGLRESKIVTTTAGTYYSGAPYRITVTKEYPRNDKFGAPVITEVVVEKTMQRPDGTTYIERELKVRDINGNLKTLTVTQIELKSDGAKPAGGNAESPSLPPPDAGVDSGTN